MNRDQKIDALLVEYDARTEQMRAATVQQFKYVLAKTDDKLLLDLAETAGNTDGVVNSIATTVGLPLTNFSDNLQLQIALRSIILTRLIALQPKAIAQNYAWYYAGTAGDLPMRFNLSA